MTSSVAVLFCSKDSIYKAVPGADCWDVDRNAMLYTGELPAIAHPPCQLWGKMARVNFIRWGGEHNRPGNDGGAFQFALDAVTRCGGVLEHPAHSYAWAAHGLTPPTKGVWSPSGEGWTCEVWQSAYGHRARKATWLYLKGNPRPARWDRLPGTHQVGFQDQRGKSRNRPTLSKKEANATPLEFALFLVGLATGKQGESGVGVSTVPEVNESDI